MKKLIATCGLGVDSTSLLILLKKINRIPDVIIFADTGGEKPETYHFKRILNNWLTKNGMPQITTVQNIRTRKGMTVQTLEQDCLAGNKLPDKAYGKSGCSVEWKIKPSQKWAKENFPDDEVLWTISYNADEHYRAIPDKNSIYPLIEAGWGRIRCIKEIIKADLPVPTKSACFYCPSSSKPEIEALARKYPNLAERAIRIEQSSSIRNTAVKGLGRNFSWESIIRQEQQQDYLFPQIACNCIEYGVGIEEYWGQFSK